MRGTIRTIIAIHVVSAVWLTIMLATALGFVQPLRPVYEAVGAGPMISTIVLMATAIITASLVAGLTWRRLQRPVRLASLASGRPGA